VDPVGRLVLYASWREKYKSPKILFIAFIYSCIYLFICELEIGFRCSVAVALQAIPVWRDVFSTGAKCGSHCLLSETRVFNEPVVQRKMNKGTFHLSEAVGFNQT
jgi:hypothetical protein